MRTPKHQTPNDTHPHHQRGALEKFAFSIAEAPKIIDTDPGSKSDPLAEFALDKSEPEVELQEMRTLRIEMRRRKPYFELAAVAASVLVGVLVGALVSNSTNVPPPRVEDPVLISAEAVVPVEAPPPPVEVEEKPPLTAAVAVVDPPRPRPRPLDRGSSSTSAVPIPTTGAAPIAAPRLAPSPVTTTPPPAAPPSTTRSTTGSTAASTAAPPVTTASSTATLPSLTPAAAPQVAVSAAAPAATPPPAPPPPAASRVETQRAAVQSVLGRYASAFSTLDATRAKAVWPTVNQRNLERAFDSLEQQEFTLGECDIMVLPPRALASCDGTARYTPKVGNRKARTESRQWTFQLRQNADEWTIENVQAQ